MLHAETCAQCEIKFEDNACGMRQAACGAALSQLVTFHVISNEAHMRKVPHWNLSRCKRDITNVSNIHTCAPLTAG